MRALMCFAALLMCIVAVLGELCNPRHNCTHVTCDAGHDLGCDKGVCTCTDPQQAGCSGKDDCSGPCRFGSWHCIDNHCRCGFGIPTGGK